MELDIIKALGGIKEDNFTEYQETIMKGFDIGIYDEDMLEKAIGHKYFKREGSPGKYKYYYTEAQYKKEKQQGGGEKKESYADSDEHRVKRGEYGSARERGASHEEAQKKAKDHWENVKGEYTSKKESTGEKPPEGSTNTEKAQFHREKMAEANKKNDGAKYHYHMGKRDEYKAMAEKESGTSGSGKYKSKEELGKMSELDVSKYSNELRVKRNKLPNGSPKRPEIQSQIDLADTFRPSLSGKDNKSDLKVGGMVQMFKDEPKLKITKVHTWEDKGNTYNLESSDGKIKRNNISGTKFI